MYHTIQINNNHPHTRPEADVVNNRIATIATTLPTTHVMMASFFFFIRFGRLLTLRPLLAYCASLG
jgi:hypothetical protein